MLQNRSAIYGVTAVLALIMAFWCDNKGVSQELTRRQVVEKYLEKLEIQDKQEGHYIIAQNDLHQFERSDLATLISFIVDKTMPYELRCKAVGVAISLGLDDNQIDALGLFIRQILPIYNPERDDNVAFELGRHFVWLYTKTGNERLVEPFRQLLREESCGQLCRHGVILFLEHAGSKNSIPILIELFNDINTSKEDIPTIATGLAKAGSDYALNYLITMVNGIFGNRVNGVWERIALRGLTYLALSNEKANRAIQDIITKCCNSDISKYAELEQGMITEPFEAMANIGGEKNLQFMEQTSLQGCADARVNELAIRVLGKIGNTKTIDTLKTLANRYPNQSKMAIKEIEERTNPEKPEK